MSITINVNNKPLVENNLINEDLLPEVDFFDDDFEIENVVANGPDPEAVGYIPAHKLIKLKPSRIDDLITAHLIALGLINSPLTTPEISLTVLGDDSIKVDWTDDEEATNSIVEMSIVADFAGATEIYTGTANTHIEIGLEPETTYYFRVKSQANGFINSAWASESAITDSDASGGILTGILFATSQYDDGAGTYAPSKVVDGDFNSFYSSLSGAGENYIGFDFGTSKVLTEVRLSPRPDVNEIGGVKIQGSNMLGSGYIDLGTIPANLPAGELTSITIADTTPYRYARIYRPSGGLSVAELYFVGS